MCIKNLLKIFRRSETRKAEGVAAQLAQAAAAAQATEVAIESKAQAAAEDAETEGRRTPPKAVDAFKDGQFIRRFPSIKEAARVTGANRSGIIKCLSGQRKTAGGYAWRLAEGGRG